jgi:hypothetical protein
MNERTYPSLEDRTIEKVKIASWNRFKSEGLAIAPDLLGRTHHFDFEGRRVEVRLPREEHLNRGEGYDTLVECTTWFKGHIPAYFHILRVDVLIDVSHEVELEEELLKHPPRREHLTTPSRAKFLDSTVEEHQSLAFRAFDYWIRVVRWKNDFWRIGQPEVYGYQSGWGTYLLVKGEEKHFWATGHTVPVPRTKAVAAEVWEAVQTALHEGLRPPTWFEFLYDAHQELEVGDKTGCILSLAIASETMFRRILEKQVPPAEKIDPEFIETIAEMNVRTVMRHIKKFSFWKNGEWEKYCNWNEIHKIFDHRDKIMHVGYVGSVDTAALKKMVRSADKFIHFADRAL